MINRDELRKMYSDSKVQQLLDGTMGLNVEPEETPETSDYTKTALSPEYRAELEERATQILITLGALTHNSDFEDIKNLLSPLRVPIKVFVEDSDEIGKITFVHNCGDIDNCNCYNSSSVTTTNADPDAEHIWIKLDDIDTQEYEQVEEELPRKVITISIDVTDLLCQ